MSHRPKLSPPTGPRVPCRRSEETLRFKGTLSGSERDLLGQSRHPLRDRGAVLDRIQIFYFENIWFICKFVPFQKNIVNKIRLLFRFGLTWVLLRVAPTEEKILGPLYWPGPGWPWRVAVACVCEGAVVERLVVGRGRDDLGLGQWRLLFTAAGLRRVCTPRHQHVLTLKLSTNHLTLSLTLFRKYKCPHE